MSELTFSNRKIYETPKGQLVFDYDDSGVGLISLECVNMIMDGMPNWIFCKDKLPDKHGSYLVVYPLLNDGKCIDILDYGIVYPDKSKPFFYKFDSEFGDVEYDDVIAWMPLPELWEEADDVY